MYRIFDNEYGYYAVFFAVMYPSGRISFWQQISKWYFYHYQKTAENYAKRAGYKLVKN